MSDVRHGIMPPPAMRPFANLSYEGQINDHPDQRSEYPRMLYRKTDVEQVQELLEAVPATKDRPAEKPMVINRFGGLLCDTIVANSVTEAEALSADGWEISPRAAYGMDDGMAKAVSAKDERIAELEAALAAREEQPRRGPGRPPREVLQPSGS